MSNAHFVELDPVQARGGAVFWLLVTMGVLTFAPCVLLPEWRTYEALRYAEQVEQHRAESLQRVVDREKRLLEAMRTDPAVVGRVAQRDLSFRRDEERSVAVTPPPVLESEEVPFVHQSVEPPRWVRSMTSRLPDLAYDQVFCDAQTRPIVMCLSVGIIAVAFALFGRAPRAA